MKKTCGIFLVFVFIVLMPACGNSSVPDNGNIEGNLESSFNENLILLDSGEWPQNEYTVHVQQPDSGEFLRGCIDPDKEFCFLELSGMTQAEAERYVNTLKEAGFSELEEVSEEIYDDYISVGTLLTYNNTAISIAYTNDLFCMYIKINHK